MIFYRFCYRDITDSVTYFVEVSEKEEFIDNSVMGVVTEAPEKIEFMSKPVINSVTVATEKVGFIDH